MPSHPTKLDGLPTELLIFMITFLPIRDSEATIRFAKATKSVSETPRDFIWHCYPLQGTGNEGCMNNALKVCAQHVKRFNIFSKSCDILETSEDVGVAM